MSSIYFLCISNPIPAWAPSDLLTSLYQNEVSHCYNSSTFFLYFTSYTDFNVMFVHLCVIIFWSFLLQDVMFHVVILIVLFLIFLFLAVMVAVIFVLTPKLCWISMYGVDVASLGC